MVTKVLYDAIVDRFSRMEMVVGCEIDGAGRRAGTISPALGRAKLGSCCWWVSRHSVGRGVTTVVKLQLEHFGKLRVVISNLRRDRSLETS